MYERKVGRPLLFETPEILQEKIDEYFKYCDENDQPYTISELALFLDTDRATLVRYGEKEQFYNTIKKAKQKIESQFEKKALMGAYNPTIAIFLMKNNFGYVDRTEQEVVVQEKSKAEQLSADLFGDDK